MGGRQGGGAVRGNSGEGDRGGECGDGKKGRGYATGVVKTGVLFSVLVNNEV